MCNLLSGLPNTSGINKYLQRDAGVIRNIHTYFADQVNSTINFMSPKFYEFR
jgi:hypothetical protein